MHSFHFAFLFFSSAKLLISNYQKRSLVISAIIVFCFSTAIFQSSAYANTIANKTAKIGVVNKNEKIQSSLNTSIISDKFKAETSRKTFSTNSSNLTGNIFYVAPNGAASGSGSINSPWDLKTVFNQPAAVKPGDTIYLRGGIYNVPPVDFGFTSKLTGTPENPITMRSYPGEWAVIDGNISNSQLKNITIITIDGDYTWYRDFEITNSDPGNRIIAIPGSNPPERRGTAVNDVGTGTKLINLVIHDAGQGISSYSNGKNSEYYGNVVYYNGWDAPDRTHGHGNYTQNNSAFKRFEDNLFFNGFRNNSQMYGSSAAFCRNFTWIGNVMFNGGMAWWGPGIENLIVRENHFYNQHFRLGNNVNPTNLNATVENNYFMEGVTMDALKENVIFKNNAVWYNQNDPLVTLKTKRFLNPVNFTMSGNTYYKGGRNMTGGQFRQYLNGRTREFAFNQAAEPQRFIVTKKSWQNDLGFDKDSTYIDSAPSGLKVFVRPNKYDSKRANIIIYNWNQASTVDVNVNSILTSGDRYELRNVQNYFGDVITGTYSGGPLKINMTNRTSVKPIGYDQVSSWYHDPLEPNTFPTFGVFVLVKTN